MEPNEIQEFSEHLKEAGGHAGESLKTISLAISILAVLVAIVTVLGHRTHTEAVLQQARAADEWNEYQAKKIRSDNIQVAVDMLHLQPNPDQADVEKKTEEYSIHLEKWKEDLTEQQNKAREFEAEVAHAEAQASHFDLAEAMLQISVVLCSIMLFTRRKFYFILGLSIGGIGVLFAASAFLIHA